MMKWLLGNGATIDKDDLGGTPLHDAAEHGSIEVRRKEYIKLLKFKTAQTYREIELFLTKKAGCMHIALS